MIKLFKRFITKSGLPHPWFEPEHPLVRSDPRFLKLVRKMERIKPPPEQPNKEMLFDEYNSDLTPLYELSQEAYMSDPPMMEMFVKLYSHYNPTKIIKELEDFPRLDFNANIQKLEGYETNYTYQEMENASFIDSRFVVSRFSPPKFKKLVDVLLEKIPVFGLVPPMEEYEKLAELDLSISGYVLTFFYGEGPFFDEEERWLYRKAILLQISNEKFLDDRFIPMVNDAEDNFLAGMINWASTNDPENRCVYRPFFREFVIEKEFWYKTPENMVGRFFYNRWVARNLKNPRKYANKVGINIVERLKKYLLSPEFFHSKILFSF